MEENIQNIESEDVVVQRPRRHTKPVNEHGLIFKIRQVLNILFMVLGVIAAVMYSGWIGDGRTEMMGAILAVIAISMKMAECVLRMIKKDNA